MPVTSVGLHDQSVTIDYPESLGPEIEAFFPPGPSGGPVPGRTIVVTEEGPGQYLVESRLSEPAGGLDRGAALTFILEEVVRALVFDLETGVALHTGAVGLADKAILVAGPTGTGKTSLVAWLAANGFDYLSDELAILTADGSIEAFWRPMVVKPGSRDKVATLPFGDSGAPIEAGPDLLLPLPRSGGAPARACALIVFVHYAEGADLAVEPLSPARCAVRLMECNLNARNLPAHGLDRVRALAVATPAIRLRYGAFDQLDGVLDSLVRLVAAEEWSAAEAHRLLSAFATPAAPPPPDLRPPPRKVYPIPAPSDRRFERKLTIGMATYDDYDGVYFSLQALRLYHPEVIDEVEFLVIDNHPDGPCAEALKKLENSIPNYRYLPLNAWQGTTARQAIFDNAGGSHVLCMDSHVFIVKGAVRRLIDRFAADPAANDLVHGPLLYDDLTRIATHFKGTWKAGMYGQWDHDERGDDPDGPAFDIPMQGLGLFACRREAWLGFNPAFRGFGGEEGYVHEKFRQAGRRVLCLPFLRWVHRFERPMGVPYANTWEDRIRNYTIGLSELGQPTAEMEKHFAELIGEAAAARIIAQVREELGLR